MGSELKVLGFRVCGLVFRVYGLGFWGSGSGCGVWLLQLQSWGFAKLTFGVRFKSWAEVESFELGQRLWAEELSSEHSTRIPVIEVGGEPGGHFAPRGSTGGASFHRPLSKKVGGGAGLDGSEPFELR